MSTTMKNATFSLPVELLEKFKVYAKEKYIVSVNAAVKEALEAYAKEIEKEKLKKEMMEAACDPLFMKDLEDSMQSFKSADAEVTGADTEW